jgi:hypothetical protein
MPRAFLVKKYTSENHWSANKWTKMYEPGQGPADLCRSLNKSSNATSSTSGSTASASASSIGQSNGGAGSSNRSNGANSATVAKTKDSLNTIVDRLLHKRQLLCLNPSSHEHTNGSAAAASASSASNHDERHKSAAKSMIYMGIAKDRSLNRKAIENGSAPVASTKANASSNASGKSIKSQFFPYLY